MLVPAGFRRFGALFVLVLLSGCAAAGSSPASAGPLGRAEPAAAASPEDIPYGFLANVGLTEAQRKAISAIATRYRAQEDQATLRARVETFRALLRAPTLDEAALGAYFREAAERGRKAIARLAPMYLDVREQLTDTQREAAAAALLAPPRQESTQANASPPQQSQGEARAEKPQVTLTEEQKQLFVAALVPPPDPAAVAKAVAELMRTGGTDALTTALAPGRSVDEVTVAQVKAFASLTLAQRQQLAGGE
jgi:Spy/CpxP family protein refolding chaperone